MQKKVELTSKLTLALIAAIVVVFGAMTTVPVMTASALTIPNGFITSGMIRDGQVKTQDLADNAVTSPKIADHTIQGQDIAAGVIPSGGALPNVHIVIGEAVDIPVGGGAKIAQANCPDGEVLTGGGFKRNGGTVQDSFPLDADTWQFQLLNDDTFEVFARAYAICMGPAS